MQIKGKKVIVAGMGKSGSSVIDTLLHLGAEIYLYDGKEEFKIDIEVLKRVKEYHLTTFFGREPEDLSTFDLLVLSPGIPLDIPLVKKAIKEKVEIIGELELAYRLCKGKFVAITGTNGKTTTTALVGEIFKNAQKETYVVGNIGVAAISKALEAKKDSYMITEVSSFQLETTSQFTPLISTILNITPDHLNRHKTMENYAEIKAKIFENQNKNNYFVVNYDNPEAYGLQKKCPARVIPFSRKEILKLGCYVSNNKIVIKDEHNHLIEICSVNDLSLPGLHNLENALAATAIAYFSGITSQMIEKTLKEFKGVEHRIEYISTIEGIQFINDSKATNPDSSIKAVESFQDNMILIAGGMDKGSDFTELIKSFNGRVKALIVLGETAEKIKNIAIQNGFNNIIKKTNMEECVEEAFQLAEKGDTILLSPACASWDMYSSYEERGQHFKDCVFGLRRTLNV